jgi:hypothetical protein
VEATEAVAAILGDDESDGRHVPDLMTQRSRIVAVQRFVAAAAGGGFALQHAVGPVVEGALRLGMSVLAAGFLGRGRLGRCAFEGRWVGRRRLGGVGRVLVEALLEFRHLLLKFLKPLLVALDKS